MQPITIFQLLLLLGALVCALAAAFGVSWGRVNAIGLALSFFFLDLLVGLLPALSAGPGR